MKPIHFRSHQILVFNVDDLPLYRIRQRKFIEETSSLFQFEEISIREDGNALAFGVGSCLFSQESAVIRQLVVDDRRIIVECEGTTEQADLIINKFVELVNTKILITSERTLQPIFTANESEIVFTFEHDAKAFFSKAFFRAINEDSNITFGLENVAASIKPGLIHFAVTYDQSDKFFVDHHLQLSPKEFQIGPRPGVPLSERVFYSRAPISTNDHINLLRNIENVITEEY